MSKKEEDLLDKMLDTSGYKPLYGGKGKYESFFVQEARGINPARVYSKGKKKPTAKQSGANEKNTVNKHKKNIKKAKKIPKNKKYTALKNFLKIVLIAGATLLTAKGCEQIIKNSGNSLDKDTYKGVEDIIKKGVKNGYSTDEILQRLGVTKEDVMRIINFQEEVNEGTIDNEELLTEIKELAFDVTKRKIANSVSETKGVEIEQSDVILKFKPEENQVGISIKGVGEYSDGLFEDKVANEIEDSVRTIGEIQEAELSGSFSTDDLKKWIKRISKFAGLELEFDEKGNFICKADPFSEQKEVDYINYSDDYANDSDVKFIEKDESFEIGD